LKQLKICVILLEQSKEIKRNRKIDKNGGVMEVKFLLNISSRTIHDAFSTDNRCRLSLIAPEHKIVFVSLAEAVAYLPEGKKPTKTCSFCLGRDYADKESKK